MISNRSFNTKLELLQNKSQRFSKSQILNMNSHSELIFALKKKYPIFFNVIDNNGMQYKQLLSGFFKCIINSKNEPFAIKVLLANGNIEEKIFNVNSANYNYIRTLPWNMNNILKCYSTIEEENNIRFNKEQFMQSLIVLFPKFIRKNPKVLLKLNNKLAESNKMDISSNHLYNYLIYCGDKLAKQEFNYSKNKKIFKISKVKFYNFLKILTYAQLKSILTKN